MGKPQTERVLLIGLDGADWKLIKPLIEAGRLPTWKAFLEEGVHGNIATLKPTLSPMLWQSIATSKRAGQHGVHGFTEVDSDSGKVRPVSRSSRSCAALWDILSSEGKRCNVINWFASHPAQSSNGICFSDLFAGNMPPIGQEWPLLANSVAPMAPSEEIEDLRLHASELPEEFIRLFIPRLDEVDSADVLPHALAREVASSASVQAAALWAMDQQPWDFTAVYFRMIDLLGHYFMKFQAPRHPSVDEKQFELYQGVVDGAYQMFDLMLANLLQRVGPEDTVVIVSDHGFYRPEDDRDPNTTMSDPESWHREQGVLAMRGPAINVSDSISGTSLLDVTPTILHLFGLPVGNDMRGRVLTEAFKQGTPADFITTWEGRADQEYRDSTSNTITPEESLLLLKQMEELGYISKLSDDDTVAAKQVVEQNRWQLVIDYLDAKEFESALPLIERLCHDHPENTMYRMRRAIVLWRLGLSEEAEQGIKEVMSVVQELPVLSYLRGQLALEKKDHEQALKHFRISAEKQDSPNIQIALGDVFLAIGQTSDAEQAYRKALIMVPESALAYSGLARVYLRQQDWLEASQAALQSLGYVYTDANTHYGLGFAMERMGMTPQAMTAFEGCLKYNPHHSGAHRCLARLYARQSGSEAKVEFHTASIDQRKDIFSRRRARIEALRADLQSGRLLEPSQWPNESHSEGALESHASVEQIVDSDTVFVVTGLPRSGTSLMMQVLAAGGMEVKTDGVRAADTSNPEGYYEWEGIKALPDNTELLSELNGQVVKIVSPLIPFLPSGKKYRILYMYRSPDEVARSQNAMLRLNSDECILLDEERLSRMLSIQEQSTHQKLKENPDVDLLAVPYREFVDSPSKWVELIRGFIGKERLSDGEGMVHAIKPKLYRIRTET